MHVRVWFILVTAGFLLSSGVFAGEKKCEAWGGCYENPPRLSDEETVKGIRNPADLMREQEEKERRLATDNRRDRLYKDCIAYATSQEELEDCKTKCLTCKY